MTIYHMQSHTKYIKSIQVSATQNVSQINNNKSRKKNNKLNRDIR